jgi:hypothetical protein
MSVPWKQQPKEVLFSWISALDSPTAHRTLSEWEQHFLATLSFQLNKSGTLSQKQQDILERIYTEKTK